MFTSMIHDIQSVLTFGISYLQVGLEACFLIIEKQKEKVEIS